jgi:hypothetical protein
VALPLPPPGSCAPGDAPTVDRLLDSVIAWRPGAATTYQFYEEVDNWLGPWGAGGYPIGYGKKYNIAFATNPPLNRDLVHGRPWVRNTTVLLQEAIKRFLVSQVLTGTIATLRAAAFDSHPKAYLDGGLLDVAENSPELVPVIIAIPIAEFNPTSPNFKATWIQVFKVLTTAKILDLLRAVLGAESRSELSSIAVRFIWEAAQSRIAGFPPLPPGARDDNFWDKLGLWGGLVNVFDR